MANENALFDDAEFFFNTSLDLLCIAGLDGYFKKINPSFSRILGYSTEELLSRPFAEYVHPNDIEATQNELANLKQGNNTLEFENRYRCEDGSYRVFSWTAKASEENNRIYAVARDVTNKRETERNLQQLRDALASETILALTDATGTIVEVNDKFCEISGYSRKELIGSTHSIVNSGKHPPSFFVDMWRTISRGKPWSGMIENRRKDGSHYFVQSVITPIYDAHEKITNYLAIRFDTTRHMERKALLDKTLSILNETGEIAKVGGWEMDVQTSELTWTKEIFRILEVEQQDDHKPILPEGLDLFIEEHKPIIEKAVTNAALYGTPYSLELQAKTAKGNALWVYTNGKANYEDGKIVSISGTIQDINNRKIAELNYLDEKQKSIQNAKLASLGELAAGIAHEINNPLSIIDGSAQLMLRYLDNPDKLEEKIEIIEENIQRIARIVTSLKKFSRTSGSKERTEMPVKQIVSEAIILTDAKCKRFNIPVEFRCETDGTIMCDEIEIEQVFVNLINNAVDAVTGLEETWIQILIQERNEQIICLIHDSGKGIPADTAAKLFDPFFTTKEVGKGTGLGLSICAGILDEHNATIEIDHEAPNTCFIIQFNKHKGAEA